MGKNSILKGKNQITGNFNAMGIGQLGNKSPNMQAKPNIQPNMSNNFGGGSIGNSIAMSIANNGAQSIGGIPGKNINHT